MTTAAASDSADPLSAFVRAKRDLGMAIVLMAAMAVLLNSARAIPNSPYEPMGPRFLAVVVPVLIIGLSGLLALRSLAVIVSARETSPLGSSGAMPVDRRWMRPFVVLLMLGVYGVSLQQDMPYLPATACFIMAASYALDARVMSRGQTVRAWVQVALVALIVALVVQQVFVNVLSILLP